MLVCLWNCTLFFAQFPLCSLLFSLHLNLLPFMGLKSSLGPCYPSLISQLWIEGKKREISGLNTFVGGVSILFHLNISNLEGRFLFWHRFFICLGIHFTVLILTVTFKEVIPTGVPDYIITHIWIHILYILEVFTLVKCSLTFSCNL